METEMNREDIEQQVLEGVVEEAMAPFEYLYTPRGREVMKEMLEDALATHPATAELLEQLYPQKVVQRSGTVNKEAPKEAADGAKEGVG